MNRFHVFPFAFLECMLNHACGPADKRMQVITGAIRRYNHNFPGVL